MNYHFTLIRRPSSKELQIIHAGVDVENKEPQHPLVALKLCSYYGEVYGGALKIKNTVTTRSSNPIPGLYLEKTLIQKDIHPPRVIAALFTIAKTWKLPKWPWTDECKKLCSIDSYEYLYLYTWICYSIFNKEWHNATCSNVDWEMSIQSEVRQRKTNILWDHLYVKPELWYKWTYLQIRNRLIYRKQTHGHHRGKGGGGINEGLWISRGRLYRTERQGPTV